MLEGDLGPDSPHLAPLLALCRNAHRLEGLTDQVSNLARLLGPPPPSAPRRLRIADFLQEQTRRLAPFARDHRVTFRLEVPREIERVVDERNLRLIVEALLRNAIEASPPLAEVCVAAQALEHGLEISVQDQGTGLRDEEFLAYLLPLAKGPSKTEYSDGLGLGLTVAARCAEGLGGKLRLDFMGPPDKAWGSVTLVLSNTQ